jgi:hypothetical protein
MLNIFGTNVGLRATITATEGEFAANIIELDGGVILASGSKVGDTTSDKIRRSSDGGVNWTTVLDVESPNSSFRAHFRSSNGYLFFGTIFQTSNGLGLLYRSTDNGLTWEKVLTSPSSAFWYLAEDMDNNLFAAEYSWGIQDANENYGQGIWKSTDAGSTWVRWFVHPTAPNVAPDYRNSIRHIHAIWVDEYDNQLYASFGESTPAYYDGGNTYKINPNGTLGELVQTTGNGMTGITKAVTGDLFFADDEISFTMYRLRSGVRTTVFTSTDFGVSPGAILSMATGKHGVLYALPNGLVGGVFASYDDGDTWGHLVFGSPAKQVLCFASSLGSSDRLYISTAANFISIPDYTKSELMNVLSSKLIITGIAT